LATKNQVVALSLLSPPWRDGEENQKEKAKLIGCCKNSLTEWQREKKITFFLQFSFIFEEVYAILVTYCYNRNIL